VDEIHGYHIVPGAGDWKRTAPGVFRALKLDD
jgi:hypothetical protein